MAARALYEPPRSLDAAAIRRFQDYRAKLDALLAGGRRGDAVTLFMRLVGAGLAGDESAAPQDAGASLQQSPVWPIFESVAPTLVLIEPVQVGRTEVSARTDIHPQRSLGMRDAEHPDGPRIIKGGGMTELRSGVRLNSVGRR